MAKLSLKHIYKIYDNGTKAVNDFNLEIGDDEFIVFVGPSGCGKSTTLRMIAGLEDITAGDFYIDGELANQLEPKDRDMAMVFQNYALYPHMTVYDNMAFGLKIRHVPKTEIDERVQEAARILDISDQLTKKPKAMSGGQRQRVALGRAIVRKPKVFLLDEPLSNLDAKLRSSMRSEITRLHKVLGTTFIYVTHDQVEAMTMGTRIVVMSKGVMQQVDTPMNLYDYPANLFVAGFIGTPQMNFLSGVLKYKDAHNVEVVINKNSVVIPIKHLKHFDLLNVYKEKHVKLGVRPEHISLCKKDDANAIKMTIALIEALGNDSNLILESSDGTKVTIKTLRNDAMRIGDEVYINFDLSKTHIFDEETSVTLLPRRPISYTVRASLTRNVLNIFGNKVELPPVFKSKLSGKSLFVNFPISAIIEGKTFSLPIVEKIQVDKEWVNIMQYGDEYIAKITSEYVYGDTLEFDLDYSSIDIYDDKFNLVVNKLDKINFIEGKLTPVKRSMLFVKKTMKTEEEVKALMMIAERDGLKPVKSTYKTKTLFDYHILGNDVAPSSNAIIKIYSLLGKKFYMHDIRYEINADDITKVNEGGYFAKVIKILDYGNSVYYDVCLEDGGTALTINSHGEKLNEGDTIIVNFDVDDVGVFDLDFGVKLI